MTTTINIKGIELKCEGNYSPGEAMVMYYSDGSGYPGSPPEFEITKIIYEGVDVYDLIESLHDDHLPRIEDLCIESINY